MLHRNGRSPLLSLRLLPVLTRVPVCSLNNENFVQMIMTQEISLLAVECVSLSNGVSIALTPPFAASRTASPSGASQPSKMGAGADLFPHSGVPLSVPTILRYAFTFNRAMRDVLIPSSQGRALCKGGWRATSPRFDGHRDPIRRQGYLHG